MGLASDTVTGSRRPARHHEGHAFALLLCKKAGPPRATVRHVLRGREGRAQDSHGHDCVSAYQPLTHDQRHYANRAARRSHSL